MKIEFENSIRRLSFLCRLTDIKITWINSWTGELLIKQMKNWKFLVIESNHHVYTKFNISILYYSANGSKQLTIYYKTIKKYMIMLRHFKKELIVLYLTAH